jgi:hypothetical protein
MEVGAQGASGIAQKAAEKIVPDLKRDAIANQAEVLGAIGNPLFRMAAKKAYPFLIDQIPTSTGIVCDRLLSSLAGLSVTEIVDMVVAHASQKNETVHPSLKNYFPALRNPSHGSEVAPEIDETHREGKGPNAPQR